MGFFVTKPMLLIQNDGEVPKRIGRKVLYFMRLFVLGASESFFLTRRTAMGITAGLSLLIFPLQAGVTRADFEPILPLGDMGEPFAQSTTIEAAPELVAAVRERRMTWITAYSSTPEETDDDPFITASSKHVRDGVVATNYLPIGTKIRIPAHFGDKVFIVEDRMHPRKKDFVDVWMPTKQAALAFGITRAEIEILQ